uniref:DUF659 domain-containing protein n=1 Tax=Strongyloides venezuelensis TaxID=75913 RepID=A0A0K0FYP7_STRVS
MSLTLKFGDINPLTLTSQMDMPSSAISVSCSGIKTQMSEMDLNAISKIIDDECLSEKLIHKCGLLPLLNSSKLTPKSDNIDIFNKSNHKDVRSPATKLIKHKFWGVCKDLQFNPLKPECEGSVTTKFVRSKKFTDTKLAKYRCTKCYKEISQKKHLPNVTMEDIENSCNIISPTRASSVSSSGSASSTPPSIFARELVFLIWAFSERMPVKVVKQVADFMFPNMTKHTIISWFEFLRTKIKIAHEKGQKIGGAGEFVQLEIIPFHLIEADNEEVLSVLNDSFIPTKENLTTLKNLGICKERGAVVTLYHKGTNDLRYRYLSDSESKESLFSLLRTEVVPKTILSAKLNQYFKNEILAMDDEELFVFYNLKDSDVYIDNEIEGNISSIQKQIIGINMDLHECGVVDGERNDFVDASLITQAWFNNQLKKTNQNCFINLVNELKIAVNT